MFGSYFGYGNMGRIGSRGCDFLGADWWSRGLMIGLVLIGITVIVLLAVQFSRRSHGNNVSQEALQVLKKRYARGEISREEFESIKKNLY